eukprot:7879476-Alexandrium_andersonii.AAC.1
MVGPSCRGTWRECWKQRVPATNPEAQHHGTRWHQRHRSARRTTRTPEGRRGRSRATLRTHFDCDGGPGHRSSPNGTSQKLSLIHI